MDLNLGQYPIGGYGLVLLNGIGGRSVVDDIKSLESNVSAVVCETLDSIRTNITFRDFLNIFLQKQICMKLFHTVMDGDKNPYDREKAVVKSLYERLTPEEISEYTCYTTSHTEQGDFIFFEIMLINPIVITHGGNPSKSQRLSKLCCVVNQKFDNGTFREQHIDYMYKTLMFLNTRGIFHCDVKFENIMFLNDTPRLVDFGSVGIDKGVKAETYDFYNATKFIHQYIHSYFKNEILSRGENTISRDLKRLFDKPIQAFIESNRNKPTFTPYMLHKKDCYDLAMSCLFSQPIKDKVYNMNAGGLFSACFGAKCNDEQPVTMKTNSNEQSVRDKLQRMYSALAPLIFMDNIDFLQFSSLYHVTMIGGKRSKARKTQKLYIQLRSNNKKYLVRKDKKGTKYILASNKNVLLSSIRNQYRYV
jgi:hypothetical protein